MDINDDQRVEKEGTYTLASDSYTWPLGDIARDLMVPGDILVKVGHVAIVQEVEFMTGTRFIGVDAGVYLERVTIIHSTNDFPANTWKVKNDDKWSKIGREYKPKRLIVEE